MTTSTSAPAVTFDFSALFPPLTMATLATAVLAGAAADTVWEIWARFITPLWVGGPLQPAALVRSVFGLESWTVAELIHIVVGVVFYPLGYLYIARPLARLGAEAAYAVRSGLLDVAGTG